MVGFPPLCRSVGLFSINCAILLYITVKQYWIHFDNTIGLFLLVGVFSYSFVCSSSQSSTSLLLHVLDR